MRPIIHLRHQTLISLTILTFPLVHKVHHLLNLRHLLDLRQDGLQLHHLLVVERARTGDTPRERLHPRSEQQEPQLIPIPMSDGDDDQPPRDEKRRERYRSRERVYPHAQKPHVSQTQPMVTPELDDVSDEDFTDVNPSSPSAGPHHH